MGEVRFWPRLVGGPGDGRPIPPDSRLRVRMPDPDREAARWHGQVPESKTVMDTVDYVEYKVEIVPGEIAVRFFALERWTAAGANRAFARLLVEAAFASVEAAEKVKKLQGTVDQMFYSPDHLTEEEKKAGFDGK